LFSALRPLRSLSLSTSVIRPQTPVLRPQRMRLLPGAFYCCSLFAPLFLHTSHQPTTTTQVAAVCS
jgi:hypothetical protein